MVKFIRLKLSRIKYSGDTVGDDIRVEAECLNKFVGLNMRLKRGNVRALDFEIGQFLGDGASLTLPLSIKIIERDLIFNDIGIAQEKLKVNLNDRTTQVSTYQVEVRELRNFMSRKKAAFEITVEARVSDAIKYVPDLDESQGFLKIKLEDDKSIESLPAYMKIKGERQDAKREHFTVLEGPYRGRLASVVLKNDGASWLITDVTHQSMVHARYSLAQKTFALKGKKYQTVDYPSAPWRKGWYDIEIPDYFHEGGRTYLNQAKRAGTWFRIGHDGARYLHAGGYSLGCMTVTEISRWMEIYNTLITARKGDGMSAGVLEIVD